MEWLDPAAGQALLPATHLPGPPRTHGVVAYGPVLNPLSIVSTPHPVPIGMGTVSILPALTERTALLGACVVLVLRCQQLVAVARYLLPGPATRRTLRPAWFSQQAFEWLEYKLDCFQLPWSAMRAELYGGGAPLPPLARDGEVGPANVAAARAWLGAKGIPVTHDDVGGAMHRLLVLRDGQGLCTPIPPVPGTD